MTGLRAFPFTEVSAGPSRRTPPVRRRPFAAFGALLLAAALLSPAPSTAGVLAEWDALEKKIRDNLLEKSEARRRLLLLYPVLLAAAKSAAGGADGRGAVFPVRGAALADVGGKNGDGYRPGGYDYYDGRRHTGHPAHDIFVRDADFDSRDDATGSPVEVLAFDSGVVAAVNTAWEPGNGNRGGIYVWIFHPGRGAFSCYAHLSRALVGIGHPVRAGEVIGHVGRTGVNAWPRRSPTHLHFTTLRWDGGRMTPFDPYPELRRAFGKR